jgi:hypothetical protein
VVSTACMYVNCRSSNISTYCAYQWWHVLQFLCVYVGILWTKVYGELLFGLENLKNDIGEDSYNQSTGKLSGQYCIDNYVHACLHVCLCACMCVCACVCVCMYVCMYVCMSVRMVRCIER